MLSCDAAKKSAVQPYHSARKSSDAPSRKKASTSSDVPTAAAR